MRIFILNSCCLQWCSRFWLYMLVFLQCKANSVCYTAHVVNPVPLPFLNRKVMCFLNRTTHINIQLLQHDMLFVVYNNCPGKQDPQISHQLNTCGTWWSRNLLFLLSRQNHCQIATMSAWCLEQSIAGWYSAPLWPFECENTYLHCCQRGIHCVLMWLFGHLLLWHVCFIWSEFVIIYSYNDKLAVTSMFNTMNLSLKVLHFFSW